ncbi:MAG: 1,4-dihydroxy-2-naphthoate octaprenyltransferase [Flavobacteriaceae bacterium]
MDVKNYIQAARLRTLPLSISGIVMGSFIAYSRGFNNYKITILALLTTIGFQIISNFANDYGDGVKGTDNDDRIGPKRALQTGAIKPKHMLNAIVLTSFITFLIALLLIYISFGKEYFMYSIIFLFLGLISIGAAIKYTMGKNAYGYSGFGDIFVFLFFGILGVCGSYFLYSKQIDYTVFLPAISIGLLSTAVLNLNNMRDINNDKLSNKNTLVVKMGNEKAKIYHYFLLVSSFVFSVSYIIIHYKSVKQLLFILAFAPIFIHLKKVYSISNPKDFDPELKKLALSTFLFSMLFGVGLLI